MAWVERRKNTFYRRLMVDGRKVYEHRHVWEQANGTLPDGMMIDHIDGNGLNNDLSNLRLVDTLTNNRNARRAITNTSGVSGVARGGRAWRAYGKQGDRQHHLGYFDCIGAAACRVALWQIERGFTLRHGSV